METWQRLLQRIKKHGRPEAAVLVVQSHPFRDSRTKLYGWFQFLPPTALVGLRRLRASELLLSHLLQLHLQLADLILLLANDSLVFRFGVPFAAVAFDRHAR
jgi:hypothetical protein